MWELHVEIFSFSETTRTIWYVLIMKIEHWFEITVRIEKQEINQV